MRPGYASTDGAALHFVGDRLVRAVSSRPAARAYRMRCVRGRVIKSALRVSYLGEPARAADARPQARWAAVPGPPVLAAGQAAG